MSWSTLRNPFKPAWDLGTNFSLLWCIRSLHEEINLIPEEEYAKSVGASEACKSKHQQTLDRLYWELEQRKKLLYIDLIHFVRLHSNLNDISRSMAQVKEKIATKQAYLDRIGGSLRNILEVAFLITFTWYF